MGERFVLTKRCERAGWLAFQRSPGSACRENEFEVIPASEVEPLVEAALRILARQDVEGEEPFFAALRELREAIEPFEHE